MARVASCPQCDHELTVPSDADGEAWAKCPECRAFFQVKQVAARELPTLLIVDSEEAGIDSQVEPISDDFAYTVKSADPADELLSSPEDEELALDDSSDEPKSGDELEAAAQRIDEWFRSNKTVPDVPAPPADDEISFEDNTEDEIAPASPARTNATIDLDADGLDDMAAMADFDLDDPVEPSQKPAAWDDSERMQDLLADIEMPSSDEFVAAVTRNEENDETVVVDSPFAIPEKPAIHMYADDAAPEVTKSKRGKPRRQRSLVRSLLLVMVAGLFGASAGYYALLWLRGPSVDFLQVAQYLPPAMLPSSFQEPAPIARTTPPAAPADVVIEAEPVAEPETPQELAPVAEETAEPAATDAAPSEVAETTSEAPAEIQAGYTETESPAEQDATTVGDRYAADANQTDTAATEETAATDLTAEKPTTTDLTAEEPAATDLPEAAPFEEIPAATETEAADVAATEPAPIDAPNADPLFDLESEQPVEKVEPVKIANAPSFTADDLRTALQAATEAQPKLMTGNFADGKEVQKAKGFGFSMLADLAQKSTFVEEAAKGDATQLEKDTDVLFRKTLADAHVRSEVAQILPKWIASPNRKHGGVFFAATAASHNNAGSVIECKVELDGGKTLTVLAPAGVEAQLESSTPIAIVGWIVDKPAEQVGGYTGSAPQAIWAAKLISLE